MSAEQKPKKKRITTQDARNSYLPKCDVCGGVCHHFSGKCKNCRKRSTKGAVNGGIN